MFRKKKKIIALMIGKKKSFGVPGKNIYKIHKKHLFEFPIISALKTKMIENIAKLCGISKDQINIKGKTTEKLGVIGKEKAIACEVIASVVNYD